MLVEHTPSYKVAASLLPHANNGICFVGYCDPDTPGGALLGDPNAETYFFDVLDYRAPRRASIDRFDLSGHANRDELADFAEQTQARSIILTHGDQEAREWFETELGQRLPNSRILNPTPTVLYQV